MGNFFAELKRRHIYRVAAAYAVVAWVLLQLVNNIAPVLDLPVWVARACLLLLALGFPIAVFFAWMRELPDSTPTQKATVTDAGLIAVLIVFIGAIGYQQFASTEAGIPTPKRPGVEEARVAAAMPAGVSIAVLPFANLSDDKQQEFFSDGMTEEITTALAKIPDLRVVARESAFQFKSQNRDIQSIGQQLHATHFIEGSVRKVGDRVRISAQLVRAEDGVNVWANSYDRQLTDVFAIQEDIARSIATSLRMPLGLKPGANLVNSRAINSEDYQQYLRAQALIGGRSRAGVMEATNLLERITTRNPNYAPAWVTLSTAYYFIVNGDPARTTGTGDDLRHLVDGYFPKIETAARKAIELDPSFPGGFAGLGIVQLEKGNILAGDELLSQAAALDPDEPRVFHGQSVGLAIEGRIKEANAERQRLSAVEPFVPIYSRFTALYLWLDGQNDAALAILNAMPPNFPNRTIDIAMIYASLGRFGDAAELLETAPAVGNVTQETVKDAARLLRVTPTKMVAPQNLPRLGLLDWVYLYVGAPERVLDRREYEQKSGFIGAAILPLMWHASWAPVRKLDRFKTYLRNLGLIDYWRARGWPDFCHPTSGDDFECS